MEGVNLKFEKEALKAIVKSVAAKRTGARALRSSMENMMNEIMFNVPSDKGIKEIVITKGTVTGNRQPKIIRSKEHKKIA